MPSCSTSLLLLLAALQQCQAFIVMEGWHQMDKDHEPRGGHVHPAMTELEAEEDERSNNNENPADWVVVGPERMGERTERMAERTNRMGDWI